MKRDHERSFTLVETMAAMVILLLFVSEVMGVQGNAAFFTNHGRHLVRASYLAKRVLDQVEYHWHQKDFKQLDYEGKEVPIEDIVDEENNPIYSYKLAIRDWKLPIFQLMGGSLGGGGEGTSPAQDSGGGDMISGMLEKILGKELFKVAYVEILWGTGARKDSESFTYLFTNKKKLEEVLVTLKPTYDKFHRPKRTGGKNRQKRRQKSGQNPNGDPTNPNGAVPVPNPAGGGAP